MRTSLLLFFSNEHESLYGDVTSCHKRTLGKYKGGERSEHINFNRTRKKGQNSIACLTVCSMVSPLWPTINSLGSKINGGISMEEGEKTTRRDLLVQTILGCLKNWKISLKNKLYLLHSSIGEQTQYQTPFNITGKELLRGFYPRKKFKLLIHGNPEKTVRA